MLIAIGYFVVNDRYGAKYVQVVTLVVGKAGDVAAVAEFNILFHKANSLTKLLDALTNARLMNHFETAVQHDLYGRRGHMFDRNVVRLLVQARKNLFLILTNSEIPLHNFVTKQVVDDTFGFIYCRFYIL